MNSLLTAGHETTATAIALGTGWSESYNYKLCMKGKGGGVFLMVFEIINSY